MRVDGLILASTGRNEESEVKQELHSYKKLNIPIVLISRILPTIEADFVELENKEGAYQATRFLIEKGHRRIGMISSSSHTSAGNQRIEGYMKALEEFQLPFESALVHMGGITPDSGYVITNELLELSETPSAIFVGTETLARLSWLTRPNLSSAGKV